MNCGRVRGLFGAYWDDEITQAEREWMDAHFANCTACREQYDEYAHALEMVASLPREEASAGFVDRVVARAKRAAEAPDRLPNPHPRWVPAAASVALGVLLLAAVIPWLRPGIEHGRVATRTSPVSGQLARSEAPAVSQDAVPAPSRRATASGASAAMVSDSIFDHTEDVEFILDPVTARRAHSHPATPRTAAVQGERAVITF
jgi:predicted anti-sigma-YlaC factor YlaD